MNHSVVFYGITAAVFCLIGCRDLYNYLTYGGKLKLVGGIIALLAFVLAGILCLTKANL
jgi:hypothetical protein